MSASREIPVDHAIPIVGRAFEARRDLLATLNRLEARHGPVFSTRFAGFQVVALLGPDAVELVFRNRDDAFSSRAGWARFIDHVFPGAIMAMDNPEHRVQRKIMQAAFTRPALRDYVERMSPAIAARLDGWLEGPGSRRAFPVHPALKRLTLDVATSTFMGIESGADADRVNAAFVAAVSASIALVRLNTWPTPYWRGVQGRKFLVERFRSLLTGKRRERLPDLFSQMCYARGDDGERFSDQEIVDHMIFVMMAAHDTSTSALTTITYLLAKHPAWQERLRAQSLALGGDHPGIDALEGMDEHEWVLMEALRLYPPLAVIPRTTTRIVEHAGVRIPAGSLIGIAPLHTHHVPSLWSAPNRFDPERFSPARAEHKRHRFAWTPFGGGGHVCIGQYFAGLEIKTTLHQLLRRYRWSVPDRYVLPYARLPIGMPRDGLAVRLERL